jgi:hypothetical protein
MPAPVFQARRRIVSPSYLGRKVAYFDWDPMCVHCSSTSTAIRQRTIISSDGTKGYSRQQRSRKAHFFISASN